MIGWIGHVKYIGERGSSPAVLPINTAPPVITGTLLFGATLTATPGVWSGADSVTGEWYVAGIATGVTTLTYVIQLADAGLLIEYRETATNDAGSTGAVSNTLTASDLLTNVQALYAKYAAVGGMYDFTDATTLRQLSTGTGAVGDGDPVGYAADLSGNGLHMRQSTAGARPAWDADGHTLWDGVDDIMQTDEDVTTGVNAYMAMSGTRYDVSAGIMHISSAITNRVSLGLNTAGRVLASTRYPSGSTSSTPNSPANTWGDTGPDFAAAEAYFPPGDLHCWVDGSLVATNTSHITTQTWLGKLRFSGDAPTAPGGQETVRRAVFFAQAAGLTDDDRALIRAWLTEGVV